MKNDLISREALKKAVYAEFGNSNLTDAFNDIIDNAPTVCGNNPKWCESCVSKGKCASTRPQSSLEKPLYKGVLFVDDYGINKVIEVDENGTVTAERIIPRDTFIEAYNKFIAEPLMATTEIRLNTSDVNELGKAVFKGVCPYTNKKCDTWTCGICEVEERERKFAEGDNE